MRFAPRSTARAADDRPKPPTWSAAFIALGVEGRFDAPRFVEAVEAVERAAAAAGVPLCGVALDPRRAAELTARGYRALLRGIDVFMLKEAVAAFRVPAPAG